MEPNPPLPLSPLPSSESEKPLESLIPRPMHLMSEEELRAFVIEMNTLRDSSQARQAFFRGKVEKEVKPTLFDEF